MVIVVIVVIIEFVAVDPLDRGRVAEAHEEAGRPLDLSGVVPAI